MDTNDYLQSVLDSQTLQEGSDELEQLRERKSEVEGFLRKKFPGTTIRYAGSYAKNTMVKVSYDLDMTCYFKRDDNQAGDTLNDIYENVAKALEEKYIVERKRSALHLMECNDDGQYTHIDVIPGRFINGDDGDVFLHQNVPDKNLLKTNLDIHIAKIRDSGVTDAIRMIKYWRKRQGLNPQVVKTFILELMVVDILVPHKDKSLDEQLISFWECLRDNIDNISVEDPANPQGNDLTEIVDDAKPSLKFAATNTLKTIEESGWEDVFGNPEEEASEQQRTATVLTFPRTRTDGAKPWTK